VHQVCHWITALAPAICALITILICCTACQQCSGDLVLVQELKCRGPISTRLDYQVSAGNEGLAESSSLVKTHTRCG